jgi:hypothetical protein
MVELVDGSQHPQDTVPVVPVVPAVHLVPVVLGALVVLVVPVVLGQFWLSSPVVEVGSGYLLRHAFFSGAC